MFQPATFTLFNGFYFCVFFMADLLLPFVCSWHFLIELKRMNSKKNANEEVENKQTITQNRQPNRLWWITILLFIWDMWLFSFGAFFFSSLMGLLLRTDHQILHFSLCVCVCNDAPSLNDPLNFCFSPVCFRDISSSVVP